MNKINKLDNNDKLILKRPKNNFILNLYKILSTSMLSLFFSKRRSISISRRILFEIEWRINKHDTYSLKGWCNRIFDYT